MLVLMLLGASWGRVSPNQLLATQTRQVLTTAIYYYFLPAMVLLVLWPAEIGKQSVQISLLGCSSIIFAALLAGLIVSLFKIAKPQAGAIILAASFPNVTYLGLPVLEQTFGFDARAVVIQMDLFAAAPLVFSLGIAISKYYGTHTAGDKTSWLSGFNTPPFWSMLIAVILSLTDIAMPEPLQKLLQTMSNAVAPLMIFALGMALSLKGLRWHYLHFLVLIILIKLFAQASWALLLSDWLGITAAWRAPAIMDIAMPSMVLGILFCDRYQLDSSLYAVSVTLTTLFSMISLPFWHTVLT